MILLQVKDYCHACTEFAADVKSPVKMSPAGSPDEYILGDTIVRCVNHKKCANLKRYLENQMKGEQNDVQRQT